MANDATCFRNSCKYHAFIRSFFFQASSLLILFTLEKGIQEQADLVSYFIKDCFPRKSWNNSTLVTIWFYQYISICPHAQKSREFKRKIACKEPEHSSGYLLPSKVESLNKLLSNPRKLSHICCPFALSLGSGTGSLLSVKGEEPFSATASAFHTTLFSQPYTEISLPWLFSEKQHTVMLKNGDIH